MAEDQRTPSGGESPSAESKGGVSRQSLGPAPRCRAAGDDPKALNGLIRILVVDDHPVVRAGLAALLSRPPDLAVVAEAEDGHQAVRAWAEQLPDVTLMDLRLPGQDGVAALTAIRAYDSAARVIMLTAFDEEEDIYRGIRAGAKAFLQKRVSATELVECIRRVHGGDTFVPEAIATKLAQRVGEASLTTRETEVLELLARGSTNKDIARALNISEPTVKSHMKAIFVKVKVSNRTELLAAASRRGLIRL